MPISFAFSKPHSGLYQNAHQQAYVLAILEQVFSVAPNNDATHGALAQAIETGLERNPVPRITQHGTAFVVDDYFSGLVPGAQHTDLNSGEVIEILLNEESYVVLSLHQGKTPGYEWQPFAVQLTSASPFAGGRVPNNALGMAPPRAVDPVHSVSAVRNVRQGLRIDLYNINVVALPDEDEDNYNNGFDPTGFYRLRRPLPPLPPGPTGTLRIPRG